MNLLMNITNLKVLYENKVIINNLNIKIYKNEILTIIGKSGQGKSTLLNSILNLNSYLGNIQKYDTTISYMPQDLALFDFKTVYFNVTLPLKINNLNIDSKHVNQILEDLEILQFKNTKIKHLSGGQKSRVALARALVKEDDLLLLDEPLSSLDYLTKLNILNLLKKLKNKYNVSLIYVTHDIREVIEISDRILILKDNPEIIINDNLNEEDIICKIVD